MKSFLSIEQFSKNLIYHRYLEDGVRKEEYVSFKPFCGMETSGSSSTTFKSLFDKPLELKTFDSIQDYRHWKKDNESYFPIHGDIRMEYMFTSSYYHNEIPIQWDMMRIDNFDIEVHTGGDEDGNIIDAKGNFVLDVDGARVPAGGFPESKDAFFPVSAIAVQDLITKHYTVFGWKDYNNTRDDVTYFRCDDEVDLLRQYVAYFAERKPDIITGWNIIPFDVPYLVHRISKLLGKKWVEKLSQIGKVKKRTYTDNFDNEIITYDIGGTVIYDYIELYGKFQLEPRDGKSLEIIAQAELGKGKLDYKSGDNRTLPELFENDFQSYIDYCIEDTALVGEIDDKRQYIRLAINMTYMAKCMFNDVFGTVGIWDAYLYNVLLEKHILCPPKKTNTKSSFPGGWVKDPDRGMHGWNMVFDIASSYPNSIITYNISPECIIEFSSLPSELQNLANSIKPKHELTDNTWLIDDKIYDIDWIESEAKPLLKKYNLCMTGWGEFFRRDKVGFIPEIVDHIFKARKATKGEMKHIDFSSTEYSALNAKQGSYKVLMNSLYGAMSNIWFRYFDIRMAGSITCAGQTSVKGTEKFLQDNIKGLTNKYIDTDSVFIDLQPFIDQRFRKKAHTFVQEHDFCTKMAELIIQPKIDEFYERLTDGLNTVQKTLSMEFEALADSWLIVEKKRYSMRIVNDEGEELFNRENGHLGKWNFNRTEFEDGKVKLKTRGLSLIQSVTPQFARGKLKKSVELIFETKDEKLIKALFAEWKAEFMALPFEEIGMPRSVTTFTKYENGAPGAQAHVRSALCYNKYIKEYGIDKKYKTIRQGDKIKFAYLKLPNKFNSNVVCCLDKFPVEWKDEISIDWDLQWEKCFTSQLKKIFETLNWNVSEDSISLEDFFA